MKMKEGSNIRTYDSNGYRLRAGCLCFQDESEKEVLLVTSSRDTSIWVVPAGGIDVGENAIEAAVREVLEEAGALGDVKSFLGTFIDEQRKTITHIYSLIVRKLVTPLDPKERKWFKIKDAITKLDHRPSQQSYITRTRSKLSADGAHHSTSNDVNIITRESLVR